MSAATTLRHEFVRSIPEPLERGVLYVSVEFATVAHLCCCGCGSEVVTPLSPTDWAMTYDGETISLHPSIGNWSFACRSHYWIDHSRIRWAAAWSSAEIKDGRRRDAANKGVPGQPNMLPTAPVARPRTSVLARIREAIFGR